MRLVTGTQDVDRLKKKLGKNPVKTFRFRWSTDEKKKRTADWPTRKKKKLDPKKKTERKKEKKNGSTPHYPIRLDDIKSAGHFQLRTEFQFSSSSSFFFASQNSKREREREKEWERKGRPERTIRENKITKKKRKQEKESEVFFFLRHFRVVSTGIGCILFFFFFLAFFILFFLKQKFRR